MKTDIHWFLLLAAILGKLLLTVNAMAEERENFFLACDGEAHVEGTKGNTKLKIKSIDKNSNASTMEDEKSLLIDLNKLKYPKKDPEDPASKEDNATLALANMQTVEFVLEGYESKWTIDLRVIPTFFYNKATETAELYTLRVSGGLVKAKNIDLHKRALSTLSELRKVYETVATTSLAAVKPNFTELVLYPPQKGLDFIQLTCEVK